MDPYEQLDLPPSTRQLPTVEQRELLTERYMQLLNRTDVADEQLALQKAWQYAMDRAADSSPLANRQMGDWVEAGTQLVEETAISPAYVHERPSAEPRAAVTYHDDIDGYRIPCPFGHEHVYDDERGGRVMLRCPSCRALFSAIINAEARDVQSQQALSAREKEWSVTIVDPETSEDTVALLFRGAATINMEVTDRFSLVSAAGARGDHPLWLVNHTDNTRWALSGRGSGVGFFQRTQPAPVRRETVLLVGYVLPALAVWGMASITMSLISAAVVGVLFALFIWRPFIAPVLLPIGEMSPIERIQRRYRSRRPSQRR